MLRSADSKGAEGQAELTSEILKPDIRQSLQEAIDEAGSQTEWCRRVGIDRSWLNKVSNGHRPIGLRIVKVLEIKTMYIRQ